MENHPVNIIIVTTMAVIFTLSYFFLFRHLAHERWQFLASLPVERTGEGRWRGVNITFYGLIISLGAGFSLFLSFFLCGSMGYSLGEISAITGLLLALCVPAVKIAAWIIERKKGTITIGGGSFTGFVVTPWFLLLVFGHTRPENASQFVMPVLAVFCTAYAFGEGIGRLSCISFGCCYGRPVRELGGFARLIFEKMNFVFTGRTRKAVYDGNLEGVKLIPVQAITAVISTAAGLTGLYLILEGHHTAAFIVTLCATQIWRFLSEFLRADYRGGAGNRISVYQRMNLFTLLYYMAVIPQFSGTSLSKPDVFAGISFIWDPAVILVIQAVSAAILIYTGLSTVTHSEICFHKTGD
jgi:hypothetical protein